MLFMLLQIHYFSLLAFCNFLVPSKCFKLRGALMLVAVLLVPINHEYCYTHAKAMNVQLHNNTIYNCTHTCTFDLPMYYNKQHYLLIDYNKRYQL
jgi:hypothetical protein